MAADVFAVQVPPGDLVFAGDVWARHHHLWAVLGHVVVHVTPGKNLVASLVGAFDFDVIAYIYDESFGILRLLRNYGSAARAPPLHVVTGDIPLLGLVQAGATEMVRAIKTERVNHRYLADFALDLDVIAGDIFEIAEVQPLEC